MARADLLVHLIQSGLRSDKESFRKTVEAIIAEERAKQHKVLGERLEMILNASVNGTSVVNLPQQLQNGKNGTPVIEVNPQRRLSDLVLSDSVYQICNDLIQEHHREDLLRTFNLAPRHRLLFVGAPGNGKTSLAEALACELMVPLFVVRYESIVGTFLGETAVRLKKLFEQVVTHRCVLFFDEFETLGKERGDLHETGEIKRVVSSLLLQIDRLPSHVVVIGATNHPELLDRAVWRRFQVKITLPYPTKSQIIEWIKQYEKKIQTSFEVPYEAMAKRLTGWNFAEIEEFCTLVVRRYVLGIPDLSMKSAFSQVSRQWETMIVKNEQQND